MVAAAARALIRNRSRSVWWRRWRAPPGTLEWVEAISAELHRIHADSNPNGILDRNTIEIELNFTPERNYPLRIRIKLKISLKYQTMKCENKAKPNSI